MLHSVLHSVFAMAQRPTTRLSAVAAQAPFSGNKKSLQKGFLKQARTSVAKTPADMKVYDKDHFAFIGFPVDMDPYNMCTLIT